MPSEEFLKNLPDYDTIYSGNAMYELIKETCDELNINIRRLTLETRSKEIKKLSLDKMNPFIKKLKFIHIIQGFERSKSKRPSNKKIIKAKRDLENSFSNPMEEYVLKTLKELKINRRIFHLLTSLMKYQESVCQDLQMSIRKNLHKI